MKKRILSLIILALCLVSVFAFASCGKNEEVLDCPECEKELTNEDGSLYCESKHIYRECINEDCSTLINAFDLYEIEGMNIAKKEVFYCPSCGENQIGCLECSDNIIEGVYCSSCGRQVPKDTKISAIFGKSWEERGDALIDSALILSFGMVGIFIVTGVIISFVLILNTVVEKINQSKKNKE